MLALGHYGTPREPRGGVTCLGSYSRHLGSARSHPFITSTGVTPHCLQDSVFSGRLPTSEQVGNFLWAVEMPLGFQSWYPWGSGSLCMKGQDVGQVLSGAFVLGPAYAFISSCTEWRGQHLPAILLGCLCLGCLHQESGKNGVN